MSEMKNQRFIVPILLLVGLIHYSIAGIKNGLSVTCKLNLSAKFLSLDIKNYM